MLIRDKILIIINIILSGIALNMRIVLIMASSNDYLHYKIMYFELVHNNTHQ